MKGILLAGGSGTRLYPILAIVHIFYPDLWPKIQACLSGIAVPYDLYITTVRDNADLQPAVHAFKPDAHFEIVENKGYDIGPLIHVLKRVNLDNYEYVIKLHTKRDMRRGSLLNGYDCSGAKWRCRALSFLRENHFQKCVYAFEKNEKLGMTGDFRLIMHSDAQTDPETEQAIRQLLMRAHLKERQKCFIAGTMFMCRASVRKPLQNLGLTWAEFKAPDRDHTAGLPHVLERFIGWSVLSQGFVIQDTFTPRFFQALCGVLAPVRVLIRFILRVKVDQNNILKIKLFKIPVYQKTITKEK